MSALEQAAREFLSLERQHPLRSAGPSTWTDPFQSTNWIPDRQLRLSFLLAPPSCWALLHEQQFVAEFQRQYGFQEKLAVRLMGRLHGALWPGNVRELRNVVERLLVTSPGDLIGLQDLEAVLPTSIAPGDGL